MNYALRGSQQQYFHVDGHEWPTLLVEIANWLLATNSAVDAISFEEHESNYVSALLTHSSTYTQPCENPFPTYAKGELRVRSGTVQRWNGHSWDSL